jgi:YHS domain-containing protein
MDMERFRLRKGGFMIMAKDPVCNMNVDEKKAAATSVYKGKTYFFCAKVCKERFDKEPEKFLTKEKE